MFCWVAFGAKIKEAFNISFSKAYARYIHVNGWLISTIILRWLITSALFPLPFINAADSFRLFVLGCHNTGSDEGNSIARGAWNLECSFC